MTRRRRWLLAGGILSVLFAALVVGFLVAASVLKKRFEPYIREQAISYLRQRFNSDVELGSLHIQIPPTSPVHMLLTGGRGTLARVEGTGLRLLQNGSNGLPPLIVLKRFRFAVDLGAVFDSPKTVNRVELEGMELTIPPKGKRIALTTTSDQGPVAHTDDSTNVVIKEIAITNSRLIILPKIEGKAPLRFDIASLRLESVGKGLPMTYTAVLTNPKPPGLIRSAGAFGPWSAGEPGDTPLKGSYTFDHADLSVFTAIAGILSSTGDFEGSLSAINARGKATVPDFRLKRAGNPVPLSTSFEVLVDGGNGNTILKPVRAVLGHTRFVTSGAVIKKDGDPRRSIALDVAMPDGDLNDVLRLAMTGSPFMEGKLSLKSKIIIPPLTGKVKEKLFLDGAFRISSGRFLRSEMQSKIDGLSRRGQGQPKNEEITEVFSDMSGNFRLEDQTIAFSSLTFATPGAAVNLAGNYNLASDALDFHGSLGLKARVSQTVTGWKHWALKPADPFFAKNGAGTFLRIKIDGSSKSPQFGLDHSKSEPSKAETVNQNGTGGRDGGK